MIKDKKASILLVIYLYGTSLTLLLNHFFSFGYSKHFAMVLIFCLALYFNKFRISKEFILLYAVVFTFLGLNLFFTKTFNYVFSDSLYLVAYSLFPVYMFMHFKLNIQIFITVWYKFSILSTLLLPVYYLYLNNEYINYFEFGFLTHLNILILSMILFVYKRGLTLLNIFLLIINLSMLTILGSRMVAVASIICIVVVFLYKKKDFKFFFLSISAIAVASTVILNLTAILMKIYNYLREYGINSRNLQMFILQLESQDNLISNDVLLSGRDSIYPVVLEYLRVNGIFPSGLSMTRTITYGNYAHTHNFFLEIFLVFGILIAPILLFYFFIKLICALKTEQKIIISVLAASYFIRSLTGTYFILDPIFMVLLGILLNTKIKSKTLERII